MTTCCWLMLYAALSLSHSLLVVIVLVFFLPACWVRWPTYLLSLTLSFYTFFFHDVFMCTNKKSSFLLLREMLCTHRCDFMLIYAHGLYAEAEEAKFDSLKWTLKRCWWDSLSLTTTELSASYHRRFSYAFLEINYQNLKSEEISLRSMWFLNINHFTVVFSVAFYALFECLNKK